MSKIFRYGAKGVGVGEIANVKAINNGEYNKLTEVAQQYIQKLMPNVSRIYDSGKLKYKIISC